MPIGIPRIASHMEDTRSKVLLGNNVGDVTGEMRGDTIGDEGGDQATHQDSSGLDNIVSLSY